MKKYGGTYGDAIISCHLASRSGNESASYLKTANEIISKIEKEEDVSAREISFLINVQTVNRKSVEYTFLKNGNAAGAITISFDKIPENCGQCPLYVPKLHSCYFGCEHCGCYVGRPADCPIKLNDEV